MPAHPRRSVETRLLASLALTSIVLIAEALGGLWTGSLALLSDAGHVFMDVFALGLSYLALRISALPPDDRHTYGFHRMQVLAALANGATLLLIAFEISREAWARLQSPREVLAGPMLAIAIVGLVVNLAVAFTLRQYDPSDLNIRSAFLHVLGDALASIGVIVAGVGILVTGWWWLDPLASALIAVLIVISSGKVLKETIHILAEGAPAGMSASGIAQAMRRIPGVTEVHDLHVWTVAPDFVALSAHVVVRDQALSQTADVMAALRETLQEDFGIRHATIQCECAACGQGQVVPVPVPAVQLAASGATADHVEGRD